MSTHDASKRRFVRFCGSALTLLGACALADDEGTTVIYPRAKLVSADGLPMSVDRLEPEREYLFFYPYLSTPCFLIKLRGHASHPRRLRTAAGSDYRWPGGVGPDRNVVAFSAICSHQLSHPSAAVSFIGYRSNPVGYLNENNTVVRRAAVIQCCSEHSIYDPAQGARVLSGPAPQPLASIVLQETDGGLFVEGVRGGAMFDRFFQRFGFRLELEFGAERVRTLVRDRSVVMASEEYSQNRMQC